VGELAHQIDPNRERARGFQIDLEDEKQIRRGFGDFLNWSDRIDILINNAAFVGTDNIAGWSAPFEQQEMAAFRRAIEVNLTAGFLLSQLAAPHLRRSGHGAIVNIGSTYGLVGPDWSLYEGTEMANPAAYAASKGGILQLTRWLATTLAPHIRVNAISPGGIARGQDEAFVARYRARTPLGRMATENDFRGALCFLASDASAYVTGHNLVVDGGWTAW
jgi:NAD(P)-dependent dehydrogenase (short-subunit alcohol dehydrogenase family)